MGVRTKEVQHVKYCVDMCFDMDFRKSRFYLNQKASSPICIGVIFNTLRGVHLMSQIRLYRYSNAIKCIFRYCQTSCDQRQVVIISPDANLNCNIKNIPISTQQVLKVDTYTLLHIESVQLLQWQYRHYLANKVSTIYNHDLN